VSGRHEVGGHHDVGGAPSHDPIVREQHAFLPWEVRTDALLWVLSDPRRAGGPLMTVDELRRGIESLPAEDYRALGYYEKWLLSMVAIMTEKGALDPTALDERMMAEARAHAAEHERDGDHASRA